ncbi:MAG: RNA 2',3'-cyclic phosphodiesterase [Spirochaetales bacterium]|nr:RNA 2',3'-cyclic phosphodiesterase [Spirochaetales bacterium]
MKIFYAVNFDKETSSGLLKLQENLKEHVRAGRWSQDENLHLTLYFIGEINEKDLPIYKKALDQAAETVEPFTIRFTSYGSFRQGVQDLLYVKIKNTGDSLQILSGILKSQLKTGDTEPLKPHITLVRRAEMNHQTLKVLKKMRFDLPPVQIESIELMESRKVEGKLSYIPLHSVKLNQAPI